ncbi:MAG: response regulator, partial [Bacteroidota bacterium]
LVVTKRFEFIRVLFNMVPHIIIADYTLGDYSGLEALTFVRRVFPEVPFLAITGNEAPSIQKSFLQEGATLFLSKNKLEELPHYFREAFDLHPNSQGDLLNMRIQVQIRENIEALGEIRSMLGSEGEGSLSRSLREEIDQSIQYLLQLSSGLREEAKMDS